MTEKKNNALTDLLINIIIPSVILMKFSGEADLGSVGALLVALSFPIGLGVYELVRFRKVNFISVLGLVSVLLTGGIGLLALDPQWLAVKEAFIPGVIGLVVWGSTFTRYPIVSKMLFNDTVLNLPLIHEKLNANAKMASFEACLKRSNFLFASTFFFSSVMNYVLARWIVTSPAGTEAFNAELGKMTLLSYPVIAIPSMVMMLGIFYFVWRQLKQMTALETQEIFKMK